MLSVLIIISFVCWAVGFVVNGFTLYQVLLIIPTVMFALRKFDIHIKTGTMISTEILFLFFSVVWKLLFHKFEIVALLLTLLLRAIFYSVVIYDNTVYVYVSEERKKI